MICLIFLVARYRNVLCIFGFSCLMAFSVSMISSVIVTGRLPHFEGHRERYGTFKISKFLAALTLYEYFRNSFY
jgi:hypothetical protein